jgi:hypothetical protein
MDQGEDILLYSEMFYTTYVSVSHFASHPEDNLQEAQAMYRFLKSSC